MNEAGEWIFSDDAHLWMDQFRHRRGNFQRPSINGSTRHGWEYGLFGFKDITKNCARFSFYAHETWEGAVAL